jgi:hypothetical protein
LLALHFQPLGEKDEHGTIETGSTGIEFYLEALSPLGSLPAQASVYHSHQVAKAPGV